MFELNLVCSICMVAQRMNTPPIFDGLAGNGFYANLCFNWTGHKTEYAASYAAICKMPGRLSW